MNKRVVVLMGGWSAEREVSLASGAAVTDALLEAGYEATTVDVTRDVAAIMAALEPRPDAIFNALHGRWGEDGCIQGLLDIVGIPYTHSGLLASAVAMNKPMAKIVLEAAGVPCTPGGVHAAAELWVGDVIDRPYVVKPVDEGSSVLVRIVTETDEAVPFTEEEWVYGDIVLVEPYIPGRELTVSVMGDRALEVTEIQPREGFYDYTAKYTDGKADHIVPAQIPAEVHEEARRLAVVAHRALGCRGVSRADFRYDDTGGEPGQLLCLEVNTQPGMTSLSLVPEQARAIGISFPDLCAWMVENAQCDV
ncbi:MAG: D-alanine--D-alanine ligase [Alphaproteobacteria bacterium]|nr:D-alanine--D-alanine ligase [Alphaproteobacteria bacterium]